MKLPHEEQFTEASGPGQLRACICRPYAGAARQRRECTHATQTADFGVDAGLTACRLDESGLPCCQAGRNSSCCRGVATNFPKCATHAPASPHASIGNESAPATARRCGSSAFQPPLVCAALQLGALKAHRGESGTFLGFHCGVGGAASFACAAFDACTT
jgi:hypothetical protein